MNFEAEPSSVYIENDTTYILYFHQQKIAKVFDDDVTITKLSEKYSENLTSTINRFEVLDNGNILIPYAVNIYTDYAESKGLVSRKSKLEKPQNLFALYDSDGKLLNRFGEFPASNMVKNPNLKRSAYFYYTIKQDKIYVTFPLGNEMYIFNTRGGLLRKFSFDLPLFDENAKANQYGNDCLLGIAIDKNSPEDVVYLHALRHLNPRKIKHLLYKMDLRTQKVKYGEISNGNSYLLPYLNESQVLFLKSYTEKEEKEIISYNLN